MTMLDRTSHHRPLDFFPLHVAFAMAFALAAAAGCSQSADNPPPAQCMSDGGAVSGTAPDMCMGMFQPVGMCMMEPADGGDTDAGPPEPLPDPSVGTSNNDDDCKYKVSFTYDCVQKGMPGTVFVVTLKSSTMNNMPVSGANAYVEAFLNANHPAGGNTGSTEPSDGTYRIGPVVFDQSGQWTVRFHFFGDCSDTPEDSPHAHAAFLINVP
jgi:hypothetical protein